MTRIARVVLAVLFALLAATSTASPQTQRVFSQAELDQMLAPVALYPDALLSQLLMAATYPVEVIEAARWMRDHPGLPGDDAIRAAQNRDWDPSVKSLVAFPQILQRMDENIAWTRSLGDAFLAQEPQVMDTVQGLRRRAEAAGNLQSSEQIRVEQRGESIVLQPVSPQAVYLPYYDPLVVYGPWWWPAYRPVAWAPWPGYARPYRPGFSAGFWWGRPIALSANFFFGNFDWRERRVRVVNVDNQFYRSAEVRQRFASRQGERRLEQPAQQRGATQSAPPGVRPQPLARQQPAPRIQAQPQAQPRTDPRANVERARIEQREIRSATPQPTASVQASPTLGSQPLARQQPAPQIQAQPRAQPRTDPRANAERTRIEHREIHPAQLHPAARVQAPPVAHPRPLVRQQPEARPQPQIRQEQRVERGPKGSERS